jgi:hypothetical protein
LVGCVGSANTVSVAPTGRAVGVLLVNAGATEATGVVSEVFTVHTRRCVSAAEARTAGSRTKSVGSTTVAVTVCVPGASPSARRSRSRVPLALGTPSTAHVTSSWWLTGYMVSTHSTRSAPTLPAGTPSDRMAVFAEIRCVICSRSTWSK